MEFAVSLYFGVLGMLLECAVLPEALCHKPAWALVGEALPATGACVGETGVGPEVVCLLRPSGIENLYLRCLSSALYWQNVPSIGKT